MKKKIIELTKKDITSEKLCKKYGGCNNCPLDNKYFNCLDIDQIKKMLNKEIEL